VLVLSINPDMAERHPGDFLQLPAHAPPVDAANDDGKVFAVRLLVKELREHFLRALQAFRFAVLPVRYCVTVVESLDATPGEGSDFYRFAQHLGVQLI
jgi:hypothetical protein